MGAAGALTGAPKGGAEGATPPEGKGNPAQGGSSRVYSNDINYLCNGNECILFADDTCFTYVHHDLIFLVDYGNKRLSHIFDWCN